MDQHSPEEKNGSAGKLSLSLAKRKKDWFSQGSLKKRVS